MKNNKVLIVVDMQNDFIDGSLGTKEAQEIVPNVVNKIKEWDGDIVFTYDTHFDDYFSTKEGKKLPVKHCVEGTHGHEIKDCVIEALIDNEHENGTSFYINKKTFGSTTLPEMLKVYNYDYIELVGLCTDICVVSNALLLKANFTEADIAVDASCCAGVTPETHRAALTTMKMCQIDIINEE